MSITELKIGDKVVHEDGDIFEIVALPGNSRSFPDDYRGVTDDGSYGLFPIEEVLRVNPKPRASSYLQRPGEYTAKQVDAAYLHITESKHMGEFFDKLEELCDSHGVDYDMILEYMEKNPNKVLLP